jgi:hypothetical protein
LLLLAEPDPSDQIMFVRYAATLKGEGARVVLACEPDMASLLARADGVDRVVTDTAELASDPAEPIDAHADLLSLPSLLGTSLSTIPPAPYLSPDPRRVDRWKTELACPDGSPFTVAIHWSEDRPDRRSIPLPAFEPLAAIPGVRLISLQKGPAREAVADAPFPLCDLAPRLDTGPDALVDTAAVLAGVDLVVTNDGPIAHLAGALCVPTWVALPVGPDWRWLTGRADSPWYPSLRLFRQPRQGDWSDIFSAIAQSLQALPELQPAPASLRAG